MKMFMIFTALMVNGVAYADQFHPSTGKGAYCTDAAGSNHPCVAPVTCNMVEKTCSVGGVAGTYHPGSERSVVKKQKK